MNIRQFTVRTLLLYDMPASMSGFGYIVEAVDIVSKQPNRNAVMITKDVYPQIAKEYCTTANAVERAIRQAIKKTGMQLTAKQFIMMIIRVYDSGARDTFTFV